MLRPEDFTTIEGVPRLGKAGRARFYEAWEERARPLRRLLRRIARETVRALRTHDGG